MKITFQQVNELSHDCLDVALSSIIFQVAVHVSPLVREASPNSIHDEDPGVTTKNEFHAIRFRRKSAVLSALYVRLKSRGECALNLRFRFGSI
jgi:hypothetical protein